MWPAGSTSRATGAYRPVPLPVIVATGATLPFAVEANPSTELLSREATYIVAPRLSGEVASCMADAVCCIAEAVCWKVVDCVPDGADGSGVVAGPDPPEQPAAPAKASDRITKRDR